MAVSQVVRGDDLLEVTGQQLAVYQALQRLDSSHLPPFAGLPQYAHVPLVLGDDGRRLAKRNQSLHIGALRRDGVSADRLRRWLATSVGLAPTGDLAELARSFDWVSLPRAPMRFGTQERAELDTP